MAVNMTTAMLTRCSRPRGQARQQPWYVHTGAKGYPADFLPAAEGRAGPAGFRGVGRKTKEIKGPRAGAI
jgi:hypothetical protein